MQNKDTLRIWTKAQIGDRMIEEEVEIEAEMLNSTKMDFIKLVLDRPVQKTSGKPNINISDTPDLKV